MSFGKPQVPENAFGSLLKNHSVIFQLRDGLAIQQICLRNLHSTTGDIQFDTHGNDLQVGLAMHVTPVLIGNGQLALLALCVGDSLNTTTSKGLIPRPPNYDVAAGLERHNFPSVESLLLPPIARLILNLVHFAYLQELAYSFLVLMSEVNKRGDPGRENKQIIDFPSYS